MDKPQTVQANPEQAPERKRATRRDIVNALAELAPYMRYNLFTQRRETYDDTSGEWVAWTDSDEADIREFLETHAGMSSDNKTADALTIIFSQRRMDPIVEMLDALPEWDGTERIRTFFPETVHAPTLPVYEEYARMLFAGAINRAYHPGCKFDELIILADGPRGHQGGGKSTLVRLLNMNDEYFHTVDTIEGQPGMEALQRLWIGELAELAGLKTVKGQEQAKNFLSRTHDHYREPYAKYAEDRPRRCILIGTSNDAQFLTDRTGNRRYLPVECNLAEGEIDNRVDEVSAFIRLCWQEAASRFRAGDPYMTNCRMRPEFYRQSAELQQAAMETDWREGMIRDYLDAQKVGTYVCVAEVYEKALKMSLADKPLDPKGSREIGQIIRSCPGWEAMPSVRRVSNYGMQRVYRKNTETGVQQVPIIKAPGPEPADIPF